MNYGYGFLEGECRRAINTVGLELSVGFLHDFSGYQTKQSLVYDLQEPYRWLIDFTVMQAFESGSMDVPDFYFTGDDYRYRFDVQAKERFIDLLRKQFNSGANYKGRILKWDTLIQEKTNELARFVSGRSRGLDFSEPSPTFVTTNNRAVREAILSLTRYEARKCGIGKSTFHYLQKRAASSRPLKVYEKVRVRVAQAARSEDRKGSVQNRG